MAGGFTPRGGAKVGTGDVGEGEEVSGVAGGVEATATSAVFGFSPQAVSAMRASRPPYLNVTVEWTSAGGDGAPYAPAASTYASASISTSMSGWMSRLTS